MTRKVELSEDVRALLRSALPVDEPSDQQRAELVRRFARDRRKPEWSGPGERRAMVWAVALGCVTVSTVALASWGERWLPFLSNLPGYSVEPVIVALPTALPQVQKRAQGWARKPLPVLNDQRTLLPFPGSIAIEPDEVTTPVAQVSAREGSRAVLLLAEGNATARVTPERDSMRIEQAEPRISRRDAPRTDPALAVNPVESELRLIARARDELRQHNYGNVRRLMERHARDFRNGVFAEERRAMSALSRCLDQGETSAAAAFVRTSPHSVFAARIIRDCGLRLNSIPEPPTDGTH